MLTWLVTTNVKCLSFVYIVITAGRDPCVWLPPLKEEKITVDYTKLEQAFQRTDKGNSDAVEEVRKIFIDIYRSIFLCCYINTCGSFQ